MNLRKMMEITRKYTEHGSFYKTSDETRDDYVIHHVIRKRQLVLHLDSGAHIRVGVRGETITIGQVGPEKCVSEDSSWSDVLDRYIYVIKGLAGTILNSESRS